MASVEGLTKVQDLITKTGGELDNQARQEAAKQASALFQSGDIKGALGTLAKVDPEHAASMFAQFQQLDPASQQALHQGQTFGQQTGMNMAGNGAAQIQALHNKGQLEAAQAKANTKQPVIRKSERSPSGFSTFKDGKEIFIDPAGNPIGEAPTASTQVADASSDSMKPALKPNTAIGQDVNSEGKIITLSPAQQKIIKETRKTFDSETKDIVKGIDASTQALELIDKNIPGSGTLEKLRLLRGVVQGRINQQEFQAFGKGQGILNQIDNAISEAEGKGMSPKVQELMRRMASTAIDLQEKEYDQHLKNAVERNPEVDPLILKKRLIGSSGPTVHQELVKQISDLPPDDQAAVHWAHDNMNDPRAKKILQSLKLK